MNVTLSGMLRGFGIALLLCVVLIGAFYRLFRSPGADAESPGALIAQAEAGMRAVEQRDLRTTLRPARFDEILRPLDVMLRRAREILSGASYDPVADYERVAAYSRPAMRIALAAHGLAQRETSFLGGNHRFMQQRGDASRYLATALWNRLEALHDQAMRGKSMATDFTPSPAESEELFSIIDAGLDADPENGELWYLRGILNRANGMFPAAKRDLEKVIELDADHAAAWNTLGLVLINLRDFDGAVKALDAAAEKLLRESERAGVAPGPEYAAVLLNSARVHEALASHYERLGQIQPGQDGAGEARRHRAAMEKALNAVLAAAAAGSPEYREARRMLLGGG